MSRGAHSLLMTYSGTVNDALPKFIESVLDLANHNLVYMHDNAAVETSRDSMK